MPMILRPVRHRVPIGTVSDYRQEHQKPRVMHEVNYKVFLTEDNVTGNLFFNLQSVNSSPPVHVNRQAPGV